MTGTGSLAGLTRAEVEDFLYAEAELLDAWELDDWLALYTADATSSRAPATRPGTRAVTWS